MSIIIIHHHIYYTTVSLLHAAIGSKVVYHARAPLNMREIDILNIDQGMRARTFEGPLSPKDIAAVQEILCP